MATPTKKNEYLERQLETASKYIDMAVKALSDMAKNQNKWNEDEGLYIARARRISGHKQHLMQIQHELTQIH